MIEINNLTAVFLDKKLLLGIAKKTLKEAKIKGEVELSIVFVGRTRIKEINKRYRGKNRVTDVLSFSEPKDLRTKFQVGPRKRIQNLGEIVICPNEVKKNARRFTPLGTIETRKKHKESKSLTGFSSAFKRELTKVLIHGILHLLGYDHEEDEQKAKKMQKKERRYLFQLTNSQKRRSVKA